MQLSAPIQHLNADLYHESGISVDMLRLDLLHPVVSGNKIFKLRYYLKDAVEKKAEGIITTGGAFSNHLVASAFAAKEVGLPSIGIVKVEKHEQTTNTLKECMEYGMEIVRIGRSESERDHLVELFQKIPNHIFIPQGGYGIKGAMGAEDILKENKTTAYTHIMAASGTGTMGAGLINAATPNQEIILVSVLKNNFSLKDEVNALLNEGASEKRFKILFDYHYGGYAKKNKDVFKTMNMFFEAHQVPTDFVYTGKLISAFHALVEKHSFMENAKILLIHSGGLQGNRSLQSGELIFQ